MNKNNLIKLIDKAKHIKPESFQQGAGYPEFTKEDFERGYEPFGDALAHAPFLGFDPIESDFDLEVRGKSGFFNYMKYCARLFFDPFTDSDAFTTFFGGGYVYDVRGISSPAYELKLNLMRCEVFLEHEIHLNYNYGR